MCCVCYSVLRERSLDPVTIAKWSHPVPSRTWKLSTCTADVALARYASRRSKKAPEKELFLLEGKKSNYDILNFFFIFLSIIMPALLPAIFCLFRNTSFRIIYYIQSFRIGDDHQIPREEVISDLKGCFSRIPVDRLFH